MAVVEFWFLTLKEAGVLAQLRTGMAKFNTYLHRIRAASSDLCACGQARETVEHFLFRCRQWNGYRAEMLQCTDIHRSNISFYLGGKSPSDDKNWSPNMQAVRATIRFAMSTGRLDTDQQQNGTTKSRHLNPTSPISCHAEQARFNRRR